MNLPLLIGAGKTTTFSMLTGDLSITEGTALLDGYDIRTNLREVCKKKFYVQFAQLRLYQVYSGVLVSIFLACKRAQKNFPRTCSQATKSHVVLNQSNIHTTKRPREHRELPLTSNWKGSS